MKQGLLKINNLKYFGFFLILIVTGFSLNKSEDFVYKRIKNTRFIFENKNGNYRNIIEYLPKNFVDDGSMDYTSHIQKAIDENLNVAFPDFPLLINDSGLILRSNSSVFFDKNSSLIMKASDKSKFSFFSLNELKNVNIYNPKLIGDRDKHLNDIGEWGMGITIKGSSNINIYNSDIKDVWGDGVYISSLKEKQSENVLIKNGQIDRARRNGISIISGKNIIVENVLVSNTNGTRPGAGIDIEPNHSTDVLEGIVLKDILTFNNQNEGLLLVLTRIGNPDSNKKVSISIVNHTDEQSNYGMRFGSGFRKNDKPLSGQINIENSSWIDFRSKNAVKISGNLNNLPTVNFKYIKVKKDKTIDFGEHLNTLKKKNNKFHFMESNKK